MIKILNNIQEIDYGNLPEETFRIEYKDIYNEVENNDYKALSVVRGKTGVYLFLSEDKKEVLYVGEAHKQTLEERIKQHFKDKDSGGLRNKLEGQGNELEKLNQSILYCFVVKSEDIKEILFFEKYLIARCRPRFNF